MVLRRVESYVYDTEGKLVREIRVVDGGPEQSRDFQYDGSKLVRFTEGNLQVDFAYNNERLKSIVTNPYGGALMTYDGDELISANNSNFRFFYDDRKNLVEIARSASFPFYTAKGVYQYDSKKNIYSSFPEPLRLYFALFRSEWYTLTSDIFRFNPGPNNILRNDLYKSTGVLEFYHIFNYRYSDGGLPVKLSLETYSFDQAGNDRLDFTYTYAFEYY